MNRKKGFTLVEILVVIVILSILSTLVIGGSTVMLKTARAKRFTTTCEVLRTAIMRYRTEYDDWPVDISDLADEESKGVYFFHKNNYKIIDALRVNNAKNPDSIQFIDETTLLSPNGKNAVPLSDTDEGSPVVYIVKEGKYKTDENKGRQWDYYKIGIDFEQDTVSVGAVGTDMTTGADKDEY